MEYFVYIIKSKVAEWYYVGHTKNVDIRIKMHSLGRVRSTKARKPYVLIYTEKFKTKSEAYKREMEIKHDYYLKMELVKVAPSSNG